MKTFLKLKASSHPTLIRILGVWLVALLLVGGVFATQPALGTQAAVATCMSSADGVWSDAATWSCGHVPIAADDVDIRHIVTIATNQAVKSLTISQDVGTLGTLRFTAAVTLTLSGDLDVKPVGLLDMGDWGSGSGSTLLFTAGNQVIKTNGVMVDFWNLKKESNAAETLSFDPAMGGEGGVHILHTLTLKGTNSDNLSLLSTVPGSRWQISPDKTPELAYLDVKDSANVSPYETSLAPIPGVDSGNNLGWLFNSSNPVLTTAVNPVVVGKSVKLTVTVTPSNATGKVSFEANDVYIVGCTDIPVAAGKAECITTLPLGKHELYADFEADEPFGDSITNVVTQTVEVRFYLPNVGK